MNPKHILSGLLVLACGAVTRAQLPTKPTLTLDIAKQIVAKAEAEAVKDHFTVVITVVDDGGNLLLLERMDGTQLGSLAVAQAKAATALKFKRPTKAYQDVVDAGNRWLGTVPGIIANEGGAPLVFNGTVVGAVGVSGMKPAQDSMVMQAAVDAFQAIAK